MQRNVNILFLLACLAVLFSSCVSHKDVVYMREGKPKERIDPNAVPLKFEEKIPDQYRVRPNDNLFIQVNSFVDKSADLFNSTFTQGGQNADGLYFSSYNYTINPEGIISLPLIGDLEVSGMTTGEIKDTLDVLLEDKLSSPSTIVKLSNFKITVLGEVRTPGVVRVYQDRISLLEALASAGDLTELANIHRVKLVREVGNDTLETHYMDLSLPQLPADPYYYLQPDDIVYVEPSKAKAWVTSGQASATLISLVSLVAILANTIVTFMSLANQN